MQPVSTAELRIFFRTGFLLPHHRLAFRADVAAGRKRLRINATCPGPVREATGTARVDNATGPRLADTVTRDYFTLRERLMTMQKQLEGAQEYIRTQCIK